MPALFPLTPTVDNCTRADENPLSNAGYWSGSSVVVPADFALKLLSNTITAAGASNASGYSAATYTPDQEIYTTCSGANSGNDLLLRLKGVGTSGVTGYQASYDPGNTRVIVKRIDSSASFVTLSTTTTVAFSSTDQMGFSMVSSTMFIWINGALQFTVVDGTYRNSGPIGIRKFSTQMPVASVGGGSIAADHGAPTVLPFMSTGRI
jgi:hypothetical protein